MHLPLTERITCPRCGPAFPLVLLAERVDDRRVLAGSLGCANCRDRFPIAEGVADLRAPPRREMERPEEGREGEAGDAGRRFAELLGARGEQATSREAATRLAALLGIAEAPAAVALVGPVSVLASELPDVVSDLEVAAVWQGGLAEPERPLVSRMVARPGLPFRPASFRGVALTGEGAAALLEEASRVVVPSGRVLAIGDSESLSAAAEAAGLRLLLREGAVVVAERAGPRAASGRRLPVVG